MAFPPEPQRTKEVVRQRKGTVNTQRRDEKDEEGRCLGDICLCNYPWGLPAPPLLTMVLMAGSEAMAVFWAQGSSCRCVASFRKLCNDRHHII